MSKFIRKVENLDKQMYLFPEVGVKLVDVRCMPARAHPTDAGADLVSTTTERIYPNEMKMVDTGVSIAIPRGFVGIVAPRSSQGKIRISLANTIGVIDSNYRGNIKLLLVNEGENPYNIKEFETRIGQLIITPVMLARFGVWDGTDTDWEATDRSTGGFGSTGA